MAKRAPGKHFRQGLSLIDAIKLFSDEEITESMFIHSRWPNGVICPFTTNLKGVSSMKVHRDLNITQKAAWHLAHRIRKAWEGNQGLFDGPVEVDETYIGGKEKNEHASRKLKAGRGPVGKATVVGAKDRETNKVSASVVRNTDRPTLQGFIKDRVYGGANVFTDEHKGYEGIPNVHKAVRHSVSEYARGQAHTNGIESFWSMLKRGYHGVYHQMSEKHLNRYVTEFAGRHNDRPLDTLDQIASVAKGMGGKRLRYQGLVGE